ncbi:MAG TPA: LysR family transcriptional regulator [Burkholderiaceae bacterium]|nr:LysR family transcriptional regulator [Burkholderiaceae bacterium]
MNDLDPAWLRSFAAIARAGSITRAAQQVHRTQSAVSTHLQQLEASLGAHLVERSTRALALTAQGLAFLPHAQALLRAQDDAHAAMRPAREAATHRLGISEYFMPDRLGELLGVLRDAAGPARLELLLGTSAPLQRHWTQGEADLVVITAATPPPGAKLLQRELLAWVAAPALVLRPGQPVPLVLLGPECPVREIALDALARSGRTHHLQLGCTGSQAAVAAIRAGWGVGCLNTSAITPDMAVLSRLDAKRWSSPGRLSFYLLARPQARPLAQALTAWARR